MLNTKQNDLANKTLVNGFVGENMTLEYILDGNSALYLVAIGLIGASNVSDIYLAIACTGITENNSGKVIWIKGSSSINAAFINGTKLGIMIPEMNWISLSITKM